MLCGVVCDVCIVYGDKSKFSLTAASSLDGESVMGFVIGEFTVSGTSNQVWYRSDWWVGPSLDRIVLLLVTVDV